MFIEGCVFERTKRLEASMYAVVKICIGGHLIAWARTVGRNVGLFEHAFAAVEKIPVQRKNQFARCLRFDGT